MLLSSSFIGSLNAATLDCITDFILSDGRVEKLLSIPDSWTMDDLKDAKNEGVEEPEEAVFPCYGVNISWGKATDARHVEEFYPDGIG